MDAGYSMRQRLGERIGLLRTEQDLSSGPSLPAKAVCLFMRVNAVKAAHFCIAPTTKTLVGCAEVHASCLWFGQLRGMCPW